MTSLPVVAVNISEAGCFDTVYGDAGTSTYLTTKYMIEMGHKKIAFAGSVIGNANTRKQKERIYQRNEGGGAADKGRIYF